MKLALFDLDDTLIGGDSASLWGAFMSHAGWVKDAEFIETEQAMMRRYAAGSLSMEEYMRFTLAPLAGRTTQEVAAQAARFIDEAIKPIIRPAAVQCLERHRRQGDRLILISATGEHLVTPIADCLGIPESLGIALEVRDGRYSGRTQGVMTYREGKVARLLHLLNDERERLDDACFYSDSANDLPLLRAVGFPQAVNPDAALLRHAREAGWPVLSW
ncbi:HAD family hydrolase [Brenneria populi subsp. brevivirga]|uniref:HAD family hydrolase n=1 Tax=Brenneria populi TaxID=1505588 RepID=UPI002E179DF9|nr:HAD family hydrolase [Brenneria populi subsp. brevivirga]